MTFQQLKYLLEVQRTGSISKAADNLYISRPSVSFCINSLEEEIGYPIFQRTRQGLVPSREGRKFLEYAAQICETHKLMSTIKQHCQGRSVNFSIFSYPPVHSATSQLLLEYPRRDEVSFSFCIHSANIIMEKLSQFELDLAVFARFGTSRQLLEAQMEKRGLHWKILGSIPTVIYIGPGHRLYDAPTLSPKDLENDNLLDTAYRELSRGSYIHRNMSVPPERVIPCNDVSLKRELIAKGLAYTIGRIPSKDSIARNKFRCIPIEELSQPIICVYNPARPLAPEAKRFMELVEQEIAKYEAAL